MPTQRQERVNSLLQAEISRILQRELKEPAPERVTITGVEVSPDLHHAKVYVSVLGEEEEVRSALASLVRQRKIIQRLVAENVVLRYTPRLVFVADRTAARAQRIEMLLQRIAQEPARPGDEHREPGRPEEEG
jgi:ribosome-binding factor A